MKCLSLIAFLSLSFIAPAQQKTELSELYPVLKSFKVKWDKQSDYITGTLYLNECVNGNCSDGEGVRLAMDRSETQYSSYTLYGTLLKGRFSEGGNRFNGKVYKLKLPAGGYKKEKEFRLAPLDLTNETALQPFYIGEGGYTINAGWDGEVKDLPSLAKTFPGATVNRSVFKNGGITWMDITLPDKHRFRTYAGHTFASGDFMFGKALLKNGDVYEGFFFRHSFHGPGKLTTTYGKVQQGIWQLDSLIQTADVQFPAALLQATLPQPQKFEIATLNGLDVNTFRHSATQIHTWAASEFYGDVVNGQATGWGFWKTTFTKQNADARDDIQGLAYGKWKHNQLDGPGIYLTTPSAANLSYAPQNTTTWMNDFWIETGVFDNGKIVHGSSLTADYSVHSNRERIAGDVQELYLDKTVVNTNPLQGCAMKMELSYNRQEKPWIFNLKEGIFNNGQPAGFYFENDTAGKRSYDYLRFAGFNPYQKFSDDVVKLVEASNDFCADAMPRHKTLFVAEMKKKLASNIAAEEWAKSPEGQAHKRQVELANKQYEERRKKECEAEFAKIGVRGRTYLFRSDPVILQDYDCEKKEYIAWRPWQKKDGYDAPSIKQIRGLTTFSFDKLEPSVKQYQTCTDCDGTGKVLVVTTTTRTKELPWGYFSGIETKSIRTTTKEEMKPCAKCQGMAIILK